VFEGYGVALTTKIPSKVHRRGTESTKKETLVVGADAFETSWWLLGIRCPGRQ
jgi:hypothetical protein